MRTRSIIALAALSWAVCAGCSSMSYTGLRPIQPVQTEPSLRWGKTTDTAERGVEVSSLQPTFQWSKGQDGQTYEFIIWKCAYVRWSDGKMMERARGKIAYFKTGLPATQHRLSEALEPDTEYYWSVRPTGSRAWSSYVWQYEELPPISAATLNGYYLFRTPF